MTATLFSSSTYGSSGAGRLILQWDYFVNAVFNYPTLAKCSKTAAFDGINRLAA